MEFIYNLIILAILFLIQATFVLLVAGPLILLKPVRRKKEWYARFTTILEPNDAGLPQEDVAIETFDGLKLNCWFVHQKNNTKGTIIFLHGVGDCKIAGVEFTRALFQRGFNIFLYDSRQHGESEGYYCTYGFYEKRDVAAVITYLQSRTDASVGNIGIYGTSMGGAVAIQAAALDPRIACIVSEGSYSALKIVFVDYQKRIIKLPWHFLRNVALVQSQKLANFKARLVAPIEDIHRVHVPVLIAHGKNDSFIKSEYSKLLYEAANHPKQLLLVQGADHNDVWEIGGESYKNSIASFFEQYLSSNEIPITEESRL
ncbi:MAG: alpha/beta hydrolase [Ignavibacteriae bacterium]|nr:MAG: alpha/beta hydrolase [Ignavibacteriota bacterium]